MRAFVDDEDEEDRFTRGAAGVFGGLALLELGSTSMLSSFSPFFALVLDPCASGTGTASDEYLLSAFAALARAASLACRFATCISLSLVARMPCG